MLVPRETPLGVVQLRNLTAVAEVGAVVPAMPGFYHRPDSIGQLVDFVVRRVVDQGGVVRSLALAGAPQVNRLRVLSDFVAK